MTKQTLGNNKIKILFVCLGNICRSPTAEGIFLKLIHEQSLDDFFEVDSAGTHDYNIGRPADNRSYHTALRNGIDISAHIARQINTSDFSYYDYIITMDQRNHQHLMRICPTQYQQRIKLLLTFSAQADVTEVPDPYNLDQEKFEQVFNLIKEAVTGLLSEIKKNHLE